MLVMVTLESLSSEVLFITLDYILLLLLGHMTFTSTTKE